MDNKNPKMPIQKFAKQTVEMNTVIDKLFNEKNVKIFHDMAFGVESTRVVLCDPIGEECNLYYKLINKMVFVSNDGIISKEDKDLLLKMKQDFDMEIKKSQDILVKDWSEFLKTHSENKKPNQ